MEDIKMSELGALGTPTDSDRLLLRDVSAADPSASKEVVVSTLAGVIDHGDLAGLSTGADHSYIDQDVTNGSSPTLDGTNFTGIPAGALPDADDDGTTKGIATFNNTDFNATSGVVTINDPGVDHDATTNFVPNEHIDHTAVTLEAGNGLSGGGDISANRSFALDVSELGVEATIAAGDYIVMEDITDNGSQKITFANLEGSIDHGNLTGLSTGADHSYIDQDVTTTGTPQFSKISINTASNTYNIELDGEINLTNGSYYRSVDGDGTSRSVFGFAAGTLAFGSGGMSEDIDFYAGSGGPHLTLANATGNATFAGNISSSGTVTGTNVSQDVTSGAGPRFDLPEFNEAIDMTATSSELNTMDGITATTAELNKMDGVTATTAELNLLDGSVAWTALSSTVWKSATGSDPSIGNGSFDGRYCIINNTLYFYIYITMGSTTTYGDNNWYFDLPSDPIDEMYGFGGQLRDDSAGEDGIFSFRINDNGRVCDQIIYSLENTGQQRSNLSTSSPFGWADGDILSFNGFYRIS
jgi:hypothetical protein